MPKLIKKRHVLIMTIKGMNYHSQIFKTIRSFKENQLTKNISLIWVLIF